VKTIGNNRVMLTWYAKLKKQPRPATKVRATDFMKFQRAYAMGVKDEDLLNKMVTDLAPVMEYVTRNSSLRDSPSTWSPMCPYCGAGYEELPGVGDMPFFDVGKLDPEHEELAKNYRLNHEKLMKKHQEGYWLCEQCGKVTGWWEFLDTTKDETGKWMYSDAAKHLWDWFVVARGNRDFNERVVAFERIMEFVHGSGPQSNWFIEGGLDTIDRAKAFMEQSGLHSQLHRSYF